MKERREKERVVRRVVVGDFLMMGLRGLGGDDDADADGC